MNREILYRGKPMFRESNNFVYGYYKKGDIAGVETDFILPLPEYKNEINEVAVLSKTVGQYTGLTDKNGKKIFEGDIIKGKGKNVFVVEYNQNIASFITKGFGTLACPCMNAGTMDYYEVVGNIHDNPELMGGTENEH